MAFETGKWNIDFWIENKDWKNIYFFEWREYELIKLNLNDIEWFKEYFKSKWKIFTEEHYWNWLLRVRGNILDHYWIKDEYLQYALLNEWLCPNPIWEWVKSWNCALTLDTELLEVPENIKNEYIKWRIKFFESIKKMSDDWLNFDDDESNQKYSVEMWLCVTKLEKILKDKVKFTALDVLANVETIL